MQRLDSNGLRESLGRSSVAELMDLCVQRVRSRDATLADRLNLALLEADFAIVDSDYAQPASQKSTTRIAIVSLLFNWPSTGGGIVHTAELAKFLSLSGYEICHFYAVHQPWEIGAVEESLPYPSQALHFSAVDWNAKTIQSRYRKAINDFAPDCVIVTDSWNSKILLAEAVAEFPYFLRLAAMECLCPLNNVRLLCEDKDHPKQCGLTQLANREACVQCVNTQHHSSGGLHAAERQLVEFGLPDYGERLKIAFRNAQAVLVVNSQIAALVEPYASDVRVIPSGFDVQRFENLPLRTPGESPFRILFAGLIEEYMKGFHVLLAACRQLWKQRQGFELWITAENCAATDPFIKQCGWQSQADLPRTMAQCDVVAVPTVAQEALGRTAVEAMGASRAVIASCLGGLKEVVCDGLTGVLVKPADPHDLMRGLNTLIDNPEMTAQFGRNGRKRFEATFPWTTIVERHYKPLFEACRRPA